MTNLQKIKSLAKELNLEFTATKATVNGAKLYNFVDESGFVVARNWTVSSAIDEMNFGDLRSKVS